MILVMLINRFLHPCLVLLNRIGRFRFRFIRWRARFGPPEVIEFPTVLLDAASLEVVDEFRVYVRPVRNPVLTPFCTSLTGIEQVGGVWCVVDSGGLIAPLTVPVGVAIESGEKVSSSRLRQLVSIGCRIWACCGTGTSGDDLRSYPSLCGGLPEEEKKYHPQHGLVATIE